MKQFISKLFGSFDNVTNNSYSGRKLSAFAAVLTAIYLTIHELPAYAQLHALYAWLTFSFLCLGIVTVEQVIRFKSGQTGTTTETTATTSETKKE